MNLATQRLILREYNSDDWSTVFAYQADPKYLEYYPWHERNATDVKTYIQKFIDWQHEHPRLKYQLALTLALHKQVIGSCGIRLSEAKAHQAELGYEIAPSCWRQGYATEAARGMLKFGFTELHLHRIWASCLAENTGSKRVMEKIGMQPEGHLRENRWMKGRYWDTLVYSILKSEWHK